MYLFMKFVTLIYFLLVYLFIYLLTYLFIYFFNYLFIRKLYLLEVMLLDWIIKLKRSIMYKKKIKPNRWQGWRRHGISRGIEDRGNSSGQLKDKWNFNIRSVHEKLIKCGMAWQ